LDIIIESQITYILITFLVAAVGGFIFLKLKVPAGPILGAMIPVMIISIFWVKFSVPEPVVITLKIMGGTFIGCQVSRKNILILKKIFLPTMFFAFFIISLSIFLGFIIYRITGICKATAFFGSAPGGLMDMALISSEFGADMSIVALLQTVRVLANITFIPFIAKQLENKKFVEKKVKKEKLLSINNFSYKENIFDHKTIRFLMTFLVGFIGGVFGIILSVPAGALIGAFIFVAVFNAFFVKLFIPVKIKYGIQIFVGAVIGSGVTMDNVLGLKSIIIPALLVVVFLLSIGIFLGFLLNKIWKIDMITAIFATAPGGLTTMSLIASDFGADVSIVTSLQFVSLFNL